MVPWRSRCIKTRAQRRPPIWPALAGRKPARGPDRLFVKIAARALLLALPLMPVAGACAQPAPDTEKCASAAGIIGDRIAACTRAVASGLLSTRELAEALRSGANQWRA